ncbi:hypothetical protein SERLA73DRAFT_186314 [Serpula lacrymans var. lacrymans S7.3]|uniref:Uncharacterized protein n=1 Tax=Serpula lacrymans var. lacrymans (strain S7.3) TaxID=936435 RepID=F8Q737_SERL3|nr:hypothetical protein SERLA73DRAFT_186314 [Serpula lacrymans var. lacrymans S7.3]
MTKEIRASKRCKDHALRLRNKDTFGTDILSEIFVELLKNSLLTAEKMLVRYFDYMLIRIVAMMRSKEI